MSFCDSTPEKNKQPKQDTPPPLDAQKKSATALTVSTPASSSSTDLPTTSTGCLLKTAVA